LNLVEEKVLEFIAEVKEWGILPALLYSYLNSIKDKINGKLLDFVKKT